MKSSLNCHGSEGLCQGLFMGRYEEAAVIKGIFEAFCAGLQGY